LSPHEKQSFFQVSSSHWYLQKLYWKNAEDNDEDSKIEFENLIEEIYLQLQSIVAHRTNYNVSVRFFPLDH
jgi:hypothetical protein